MDTNRLDQLTLAFAADRSRRAMLGIFTAGLASATGLGSNFESDARGRRKKKNKRKKKQERCTRLGDSCTPGGETTCCNSLICDIPREGTSTTICCKGEGAPCGENAECCQDYFCYPIDNACIPRI